MSFLGPEIASHVDFLSDEFQNLTAENSSTQDIWGQYNLSLLQQHSSMVIYIYIKINKRSSITMFKFLGLGEFYRNDLLSKFNKLKLHRTAKFSERIMILANMLYNVV